MSAKTQKPRGKKTAQLVATAAQKNWSIPDDLADGRYLIDDFPKLDDKSGTCTKYPIDKKSPILPAVFSETEMRPNSTEDWFVSGQQGISAQLTLEFVGGSNGHNHSDGTSDPRVVGVISPNSVVLSGPYPQNVRVLHRVGNFCGRIRIRTNFSNGSTDVDHARVRFPGLVQLPAHPNIRSYTNDGTHPQNNFGRRDLVRATSNCATAFGQAFPGAVLFVNDMSLPWGGTFDIGGSHTGPHNGHKWGGEVDISYRLQNAKQRKWFRENAPTYFGRVLLHGNPLHWHCSIWS